MEQQQFINSIKDGAIRGWEEYSILPSLSIAQGILESGWGSSQLATQGNNLFGIKSSNDWQGEVIQMPTQEWDGVQYITINAPFRKYASWNDSVADHARFFSSTTWRKLNYKKVIGEKDYKKACYAIKQAGYATAPDYSEKLIQLIEQYNLQQYDNTETAKTERKENTVGYKYITNYNARNYTPYRQGLPIKYIVIHHWGVTGQKFEGILEWFCNNPNCQTSAHYVVEDGRVACIVDLENTAWHAGNWDYNLQSIGLECRPEHTDGDYETIGQLVAELWKAYGKLPLIGHKNVPGASTSCPGDYDIERIKRIAEKYYNGTATPLPKKENKVEIKKEERKDPSDWAVNDWKRAKAIGICDGTRPHDNLTREEAVVLLMRAIDFTLAHVPVNK